MQTINNDSQIGSYKHAQEEIKAVERSAIEKRFGPYRRPTEVTIPKFEAIQQKCLELALLINEMCPHSQQKATALTQLEMCKMSANAAIAIHTPSTTT